MVKRPLPNSIARPGVPFVRITSLALVFLLRRLSPRKVSSQTTIREKRNIWSLQGDETICEIVLEKDRWRKEQFYLGFEVWLLQIHPDNTKQCICDISGRGYSPRVQDKVELEHCLNLRYTAVSDKPRMECLGEICKNKFIPFMLSLRTLAGIKHAYSTGQLIAFFVSKELKELLLETSLKAN